MKLHFQGIPCQCIFTDIKVCLELAGGIGVKYLEISEHLIDYRPVEPVIFIGFMQVVFKIVK